MTDWIEVPENMNYDGIMQGIDMSKNPKDYVKYLRQKDEEESKVQNSTETIVITPTKVKPNDVSEIVKKKRR